MMRYGRLKGTMEQCIREIQESQLPSAFLLTQVRSLVRYLREVDALCGHIKKESGWESDTTAYLEILCAKEESTLARRVSDTRILKQDFDEKRREWRKAKKNVIYAISDMNSRALKFECSERKMVALHAIQYYKNVMARDDGAIPGESESTDGLVDQYRRFRDEISKIPMYADSIMKMLRDIRRTVNAAAKLPGSSAFTQFLEEWWTSVVKFLEHSSIVEAEKNAREVMQTLKKLKGKQLENKKREMFRLMSKLEAKDNQTPQLNPASAPVEILDDSINPEHTVRWNESESRREICGVSQGGIQLNNSQGDDSGADDGDTEHDDYDDEGQEEDGEERMDEVSELASGHGGASSWSEEVISPAATREGTTRPPRGHVGGAAHGFTTTSGSGSVASWDVGSEPTMETDTGTDRDVAAASGLPEGESDDDSEEDDDFEVADSLDLGAVALCAVGTGTDGHQKYQDTACTPQAMRHINQRLGVEQKRFSAALDYFRQEQRGKGKRPAMPPPTGTWRSQLVSARGEGTPAIGRGRNLSSGGRGQRDTDTSGRTNGRTSASIYREHSMYVSSTSQHSISSSSTQIQGTFTTRKRTMIRAQSSSKLPVMRRDT